MAAWSFPAGASGSSGSGTVEYRLARQGVLRRFRAGELSAAEVCDAQFELMRVASECGESTRRQCPVCGVAGMREVRFVFGPRLPRQGRCVTSRAELERLTQRSGEHRCFVVEVCLGCRWNHLVRSYVLGQAAGSAAPTRA